MHAMHLHPSTPVSPLSVAPGTTSRESEPAGAFDPEAYAAAVALLGIPGRNIPAFTLRGKSLRPADPEYDSLAGAKVWTQINESADLPASRKPSNADITHVRNISWEYEYPRNPALAHQLSIELRQRLIASGLFGEGMADHDSGAGVHTLVPINLLICAEHGGGEVVNEAVRRIIDRYVRPHFEELAGSLGLTGKGGELGAYDISRILSMPGTWRPGGSKPDDAPELAGGYLRRWLLPEDQPFPVRVESQILFTLIAAECAAIREESRRNVTHHCVGVSGLAGGSARVSPQIEAFIRDRAGRLTTDDRSVCFQSLVASTALKYGEEAVYEHGALIEELAGEKYGPRLAGELSRSLSKVRPRDDAPLPGRVPAIPVLEVGLARGSAPSDELVITRARLELLERKASRYDQLANEITRIERGNPTAGEEPAQRRSAAAAMLLFATWLTVGFPGEEGADQQQVIYLPKVAAMAGVDRKTASRQLQSLAEAGLVSYDTRPAGKPGQEKLRSFLGTKRAPELTERLARPAPSEATLKRAEASRQCRECGSVDLKTETRTIITCTSCGTRQGEDAPQGRKSGFTADTPSYRRREAEHAAAVAEEAAALGNCLSVPTQDHASPPLLATTGEKRPSSDHTTGEKRPSSGGVLDLLGKNALVVEEGGEAEHWPTRAREAIAVGFGPAGHDPF